MARKAKRAAYGTTRDAMLKVLRRARGATTTEIGKVVPWRNTNASYFSWLYAVKYGYNVVKVERKNGEVAYRLTAKAA